MSAKPLLTILASWVGGTSNALALLNELEDNGHVFAGSSADEVDEHVDEIVYTNANIPNRSSVLEWISPQWWITLEIAPVYAKYAETPSADSLDLSRAISQSKRLNSYARYE